MKKEVVEKNEMNISFDEKVMPRSYVLAAIVSLSIPFFGLFHEWAAILVSAVLAVYITVVSIKEGGTLVYWNFTVLSVLVLVSAYLVSVAYAADRGMAFVGFLKMVPVFLFYIASMNAPGFRRVFMSVFPVFTVFLTAISAIMMLIPSLRAVVAFEGRLHGFTQYPNTYAVILLAAEIMLLAHKRIPVRIVGLIILVGGIFLTGSRAVIVLFFLLNFLLFIRSFRKNKKILLVTVSASVILVAVAVVLGFAGIAPFDRVLKINFGESTLWCRVIYLVDALPFSLRHPFGVGYLGYSFLQSSFQTAPYYVRFVHNDIMQMVLDVGWIPAAFFAVAATRSVFFDKIPFLMRLSAAAIFLHSLFDFDLQFTSVFFILIACMSDASGKAFKIRNRALTAFVFGSLAAVSVYFSAALSLAYFGKPDVSLKMYPFNTECRIKIMEKTQDPDLLEKYADGVLSLNNSVADAYSSKAAANYMKGDFGEFIGNMRKSLDRAPFDYKKHEDYCNLLIQGVDYYEKNNDPESAAVCRKEIADTVTRYKNTLSGINPLYKKTDISPVFVFPDYIESFAESD